MRKAYSFLFLVIALLVCSAHQAISEEADAAIKEAIKVAILDGLDTIDKQIRSEYWYYLRGAQRVSFNVSLLPTKLNYIIVYNNIGNIYRVNCDLIKVTWTTALNSFVKILSREQGITSLKANISMVDSNSSVIDLTDQITISGGEENATKTSVPV